MLLLNLSRRVMLPPDKVILSFGASGMILMRMFPCKLVQMPAVGMLVMLMWRQWIRRAVGGLVVDFARLVLMRLMSYGGMPRLHCRPRVPPREVRPSLMLRGMTVPGPFPAYLRPLNDALPVPSFSALKQMHRIGSLHAFGSVVRAWSGDGDWGALGCLVRRVMSTIQTHHTGVSVALQHCARGLMDMQMHQFARYVVGWLFE